MKLTKEIRKRIWEEGNENIYVNEILCEEAESL